MKKLLLPLLSILLMTACQKQITKENVSEETKSVSEQNKGSKIDVCHHDVVTNTWSIKSINPNALPGHLAHGDIVPDADGDGYSKTTPCGTGNDCNDNNAAINPGATELCGNNIDDNCNGQVDENCIPSVTICNQTWMLYNLDVSKYRNGEDIPQVTDPAAWSTLTTGAWCWYANNSANGTIYGKLYNWFAVNDPRGLAPAGWHVPTDGEWNILVKCIDPSADTTGANTQSTTAGGAMKETGTTHWTSPNTGATNTSGFTGLPGGYRNNNGPYYSVGNDGYWWSSSESYPAYAWNRSLNYADGSIYRDYSLKHYGFSVRCLRD